MSSSSDALDAESRALGSPGGEQLSSDEKSQIAARLRLTPAERLAYLEDMIAFEERARRARRVKSH